MMRDKFFVTLLFLLAVILAVTLGAGVTESIYEKEIADIYREEADALNTCADAIEMANKLLSSAGICPERKADDMEGSGI